jgi:hypothetical protein
MNGLERRHIVQRLESLLASITGFLHAAERQFDPSSGSIAIDEHLTHANLLGDTQRASAVSRPDACDQAKIGRVCEPDCIASSSNGSAASTGPKTSSWAISLFRGAGPNSTGGM